MEKVATCTVPGCERPAAESGDLQGCAEHLALYDARAELDAWSLAHNILRPWVESTKAIGSDELTKVMEIALGHAEDRVTIALEAIERAEAALGRPERGKDGSDV